ncbi:MAG: sensor domain-containing diguanylate cyclase [Tepidisphaeraceae bacterium]
MNDQIVQRVRQCPNLPSLPAIAMQVLDLTQKADVDIAEIARIISKDPALSSKILRTVNSSFYGRSQHVSTISHALVILGLQSVKTLVLGFSLVTNLTRNKSKGFKHIHYWKRSMFAATAARSIAAKLNIVQQEEAFLAALLMDIGMLVLDVVLGEQYGDIHSKIKSHAELAPAETEALGITHAQAGGILAEAWKLPPLLAVPISHHHSLDEVKDPALNKLAALVAYSGRVADVFVDDEPAPAIAEVRKVALEQYKLSERDCDALLADIGKRTKEAASLFEIHIGSAVEFEAILKKANEALVEITLQSQQQASTLQQQNQQLKKQATTDALMGLFNRAHFDEFIVEAFAQAAKSRQPLSVLMLDLDKFKSVNDKYGHPAGDQVLRMFGQLLRAAARGQEVPVRYGGEEVVLVMPGASRPLASAKAETIRRAIAAKPVLHGHVSIPVTTSIGVATYDPACPFKDPAQLLKAADLALYNAKHSGRNCVRVFAPKPAAAPATTKAA